MSYFSSLIFPRSTIIFVFLTCTVVNQFRPEFVARFDQLALRRLSFVLLQECAEFALKLAYAAALSAQLGLQEHQIAELHAREAGHSQRDDEDD